MENKAEELAQAHWGYIESLLKIHSVLDEKIKMVEFHYKTAFIHGYKHGVEDSGKLCS